MTNEEFKTRLTNLTPASNNAKSKIVPVIFYYFNVKGDTITTKGYFDDRFGIKKNDRIAVFSNTTGAPTWYIATVDTNGDITLATSAS